MRTSRGLARGLVLALVVGAALSGCGGTSEVSRQAAGVEADPADNVWPLAVGGRAVVVFPEEDYTGWDEWSFAIAEGDVAVVIECPDDTSLFAFHDPRGGACVEAVGPGTATLVWTDPNGIDAFVSTIVVS